MAGGKIFINYRREDAGGYARSLFDRLNTRFPRRVFMDVGGSIEFGLDFAEEIRKAVSSCDALIVLIGRRWLNQQDSGGRRRLDDPADFVSLEISTALKRNVRVIPALVGGASLPSEEDLPQDLKPLVRRQAVLLSDQDWDHTVDRLIKTLEGALSAARAAAPKPAVAIPQRSRLAGILSGALLAVAIIVALAYTAARRHKTVRVPARRPASVQAASAGGQGGTPPAAGQQSERMPDGGRASESAGRAIHGPAEMPQLETRNAGRQGGKLLARLGRRPGDSAIGHTRPAEKFEALVLDGDVAYQQGRYQRALDTYLKAYRLNGADREVRRKIATTLTLLGRPEEAQKYQ